MHAAVRHSDGPGETQNIGVDCAAQAVLQLACMAPTTACWLLLRLHVSEIGGLGGGGAGGGGLGESGVTHGQNRLKPVPLDVQDHEFEPSEV